MLKHVPWALPLFLSLTYELLLTPVLHATC